MAYASLKKSIVNIRIHTLELLPGPQFFATNKKATTENFNQTRAGLSANSLGVTSSVFPLGTASQAPTSFHNSADVTLNLVLFIKALVAYNTWVDWTNIPTLTQPALSRGIFSTRKWFKNRNNQLPSNGICEALVRMLQEDSVRNWAIHKTLTTTFLWKWLELLFWWVTDCKQIITRGQGDSNSGFLALVNYPRLARHV